MTAPSLNLRARRAARAEAKLTRIRAFVADNRAELLRVMRIAAGEAGAADAEILLRLLAKPRPEIESVFAALSQMRDGLAEAETGVGFEERDARSDLDAAMMARRPARRPDRLGWSLVQQSRPLNGRDVPVPDLAAAWMLGAPSKSL